MAEALEVRLRGEKIGDLTRAKNGARFAFSESVVSAFPLSPMLSTALCVREEPFDALKAFSWFSGLLPEDARLDELQRFYGVAEGDYFGLLAQIGWECAGAVEVVPPEDWTLVQASQERLSEKRLTPEELAARLAALPSHPFDDASSLRVSLGGFQEKLCVIARAEDWVAAEPGHSALSSVALPLDGAPSTHILKPQPQGRLAGLVEAEAWGMEVARHATETAGSALLDLPDAPPTLLVERFDRMETEEGLVRLHQEDCAQALGIEPGRKYAATATLTKSDPTYKGIAELLVRYAVDSLEERKRLLRHLFVNTVLGNTDAHAKNYALLHEGDTIRLAPLYDVVPALEVTPNVLFMGLRIDGRIRIDRIERENVEAEARSWGLPARVANEVLGKAMGDIRRGIAIASELYPEAGKRHAVPVLERLKAMGF
ncbi:HipA domain-containing protein [Adlercreutzia sp. R21]|uniref:HipA domain-containing protein n=1 Tax=Adlercreutzia wanghongyangiae TaxID=3111451 RepID=UPI002DBF844D|nr:HipA domain-containing protein [Adlercreutzia sp. R21]MEC4184782.1 HipA domain-containing protein [Adlercreutzia sp. R21]